MTIDTRPLVARRRASPEAAYWRDVTIDDLLVAAVDRFPDKPALVEARADRDATTTLTWRELGDRVGRAAAALRAMGVARGDVVSLQLPNWWEFVVAALACGRIGAVVNPLMHIFRERELAFMVRFAGSKVLVVPKAFRGFDHAAMAQALRAHCPALANVVVVDGDGPDGFAQRMLGGSGFAEPAATPSARLLQPDDVAVLMFTSGTTGEPKGVMHSANTLVACLDALTGRFGLTEDDVVMCVSPVGHMTAYAASVMLTVRLAGTVVLQDFWEPRRGVELMAAHGATYTAAATPFLADICDAVAAGAPHPARLRSFLCGGAPIPPALIQRADRELGLKVCSLWGMTESLSSTLTEPARAGDKSASTDGRPLEGVDVRVIGTDGQALPAAEVGALQVRGAQMFLGYFQRPDLPTFDAEGWFDTGDLAYLDDEGYIRIAGRTKDVVIRGGENVPVVEIENLLYQHPAVSAVAIVGYPDPRLVERACAYVTLRPGHSLDVPGVQSYLAQCKVAKQYWPERVEVIAEMPRTASGKIQKFVLREQAKAFGAGA